MCDVGHQCESEAEAFKHFVLEKTTLTTTPGSPPWYASAIEDTMVYLKKSDAEITIFGCLVNDKHSEWISSRCVPGQNNLKNPISLTR